jgi:hypothetical protein
LVAVLAVTFFVSGNTRSNLAPEGASGGRDCEFAGDQIQKIQCWEESLSTTLKKDGLAAAFGLLDKLHAADSDFSASCHAFTHTLGGEAYRLFRDKKDFSVPSSVSSCNYGFYHGFMEALLTQGGNIAEARAFCTYIDQKLAAYNPEAPEQCYHGIGHGNAGIHDKRFWGDAPAIITQSLQLCERVSDTWGRLYRCASGVYNAISDFHAFGDFGFSMDMVDKENPLRLCEEQPERYQEACYGNMKSIVGAVTGRDFKKVASLVARIPDEGHAASTMWYLAGYNMEQKLHLDDHTEDISVCRALAPQLHFACIKGLATGFLWYSTPGSEYKGALDFCRLQPLSDGEREACFGELTQKLPAYYSSEKIKEICSSDLVPEEWKDECLAATPPRSGQAAPPES